MYKAQVVHAFPSGPNTSWTRCWATSQSASTSTAAFFPSFFRMFLKLASIDGTPWTLDGTGSDSRFNFMSASVICFRVCSRKWSASGCGISHLNLSDSRTNFLKSKSQDFFAAGSFPPSRVGLGGGRVSSTLSSRGWRP